MLKINNKAEHEILNANKNKNIMIFSFVSGSYKPRMPFFRLINVKMPTIVGILTLMSRKNFMQLSCDFMLPVIFSCSVATDGRGTKVE